MCKDSLTNTCNILVVSHSYYKWPNKNPDEPATLHFNLAPREWWDKRGGPAITWIDHAGGHICVHRCLE